VGIEIVKLKNGAEEAEPIVTVVMMRLQSMMESGDLVDAMLVYDLVMKCRDDSYRFFGENETKLKNMALVEHDGRVHDSIRNVILSSVVGDGLEMRIESPLA
jgi:hypothetical protein